MMLAVLDAPRREVAEIDHVLLWSTLLLLVGGLVMVYSASITIAEASKYTGNQPAYYLLLDWANLVERAKGLIPPRWRAGVQSFLDETDEVLGQYLRGQLLVMAVLAVFYTVGLALVGLKLALPIGVFTGLAVFIPYLGFGLGLVLALLAAVLQFQTVLGVALVGAVYAVGQVVESMYVTPRLLGERIGLHPIAVIFALMAFGHLFGFVGVLIALPASAVLLVAIRRAKAQYLASDMYLHGAPRAAAPAPVAKDDAA